MSSSLGAFAFSHRAAEARIPPSRNGREIEGGGGRGVKGGGGDLMLITAVRFFLVEYRPRKLDFTAFKYNACEIYCSEKDFIGSRYDCIRVSAPTFSHSNSRLLGFSAFQRLFNFTVS